MIDSDWATVKNGGAALPRWVRGCDPATTYMHAGFRGSTPSGLHEA
jgi:hypothetical protein